MKDSVQPAAIRDLYDILIISILRETYLHAELNCFKLMSLLRVIHSPVGRVYGTG